MDRETRSNLVCIISEVKGGLKGRFQWISQCGPRQLFPVTGTKNKIQKHESIIGNNSG